MALNQAIHLLPDLTTIVALVERPAEPGSPSQFWDGTAKEWATAPSPAPAAATPAAVPPHVAVVPHPTIPALYVLQVPSSETASWPDGMYRITLINTAIEGADRVVHGPFDACVIRGDDGYQGWPSITVPWLGCTITLWGARFNLPAKA